DIADSPSSFHSRQAVLHPEDVLVTRRVDEFVGIPGVACDDWRSRALISPAFNLCMPIGERETAGSIMIAAGIIEVKAPGGWSVRITSHVGEGIAIIDAILALVH